jgi:hypothetical protein
MTAATTPAEGGALSRPTSTSLADVVDLILDKGLVIDAYVRVSAVGIELVTIDARVVVASVDTYLRFAEQVNRLDLTQNGKKGLPELVQDVEGGATAHKTKGMAEGALEAAGEKLGGVADNLFEFQRQPRPRRRRED